MFKFKHSTTEKILTPLLLQPKIHSRNGVEDTLNRIRSGKYVTRPEWEDLYTSMAKPSDNQPVQQMQETEPTVTPPRRDDRNYYSGDRVTSPSMSEKKQSSSLQRLLESHHQERLQQQAQRDVELAGDPTNADDVFLSASTRVSLREKHAKHMADLREYYEKELRELRGSLLTDMTEQTPYKRVSSENQNLVIENRLLREKIQDMENGTTVITREKDELKKCENQVKHLNDKIRAAKRSNSVESKKCYIVFPFTEKGGMMTKIYVKPKRKGIEKIPAIAPQY
ncbi:MPHOSPH9 [Mytilus edulis]|uniref:MPHOSPH9 n=1 Tax=Mytilus edulis TaxID=6550 RepID=A0A8S3Q733_MYTED|nr:MPHOSPH9 [Mytilus edulis]